MPTKSALIEAIAQKTKLTHVHAESLVNEIFRCMSEALARGEKVELRGFGTFRVKHYGEYVGRNPRTGDPVQVKAKRLAFFTVGKELKKAVDASARRGEERAKNVRSLDCS